MKQFRIMTILATLVLAAGTYAQSGQAQDRSNHQNKGQGVRQSETGASDHALPSVDEQLKVLTGKLDLTADQQTKIKSIMQELHDATVKLMQDEKLSQQERLDKVRPLRYNAGQKIREILTDDQQKKFDQYLHGPHHEMHGDLEGKTQPSAQPKR